MGIEIVSGNSSDILAEEATEGSLIVQIYEIQTPEEAEMIINLGVDHMGSVVVSKESWKNSDLRDTLRLRHLTPVKSALIPLYSDADMIYRTADYYQPDIMHFCEVLMEGNNNKETLKSLIKSQEGFRRRFPEIKMMRSIPIAPTNRTDKVPTLALAKMFEPYSDYFLTDTLLVGTENDSDTKQPETGFVGITGKICDWKMARKLVDQSNIPVILAGGISPDNAYDGIAAVRPFGVDSCTHTNAVDNKGNPIRFKKDPERIQKLIDETRRAEKDLYIK